MLPDTYTHTHIRDAYAHNKYGYREASDQSIPVTEKNVFAASENFLLASIGKQFSPRLMDLLNGMK